MSAINSWPPDERPREKLLKIGADGLSTAELLAILLRTGVKGENAVELARHLLIKFKGLRQLLNADNENLKEIKGLGPTKITQLKTILELARRYLEEKLQTKTKLNSSGSLYRFLIFSMRDLDHEIFKVIFLNAQNEVLELETVSRGSLTGGSIYPRDIIISALRHNAVGLIFAHNHPSGNPKPSLKDKKMTAKFLIICRLMEMRLLDHIIIGDNRYYSFSDQGLI
jgi:DNA repair protein RadC